MPSQSIDNRADFDRWLSEYCYFQDALVVAIDPTPAGAAHPLPASATLELTVQVGGGLRAGAVRRLQPIRLLCHDLSCFEMHPEGRVVEGHCMQGIDPEDAPAGRIRFKLDLPAMLEIECGSVEIEERAQVEEVIAPWESDREVFLTLRGAAPEPGPLSAQCLAQGKLAVAWRIYGGEPQPATAVPAVYEGWFLQTPDRLTQSLGGVMFSVRPGREPDTVNIGLVNWDQENPRLWAAVLVAFTRFEVVRAACGNRDLDADEFRALAAARFARV